MIIKSKFGDEVGIFETKIQNCIIIGSKLRGKKIKII